MRAIESAAVEDGAINIRTPKMNFRSRALQRTLGTTQYHKTDTGYCNFCDPEQKGGQTKKCIASCPTGALIAFDEGRERLGEAVIDTVYCINYPQLGQAPTGCRLCADACPYGAIVISADQRPEVIPAKCNGCGKCELVCPSATYRQLISVDTLQAKAKVGLTSYAKSLEFYQQTGKVPRGINICYRAKTTRA
jgi:ferredoxin-type protein NapG